jgi:hypothetical protein
MEQQFWDWRYWSGSFNQLWKVKVVKIFADIDVFDIEVDVKDIDKYRYSGGLLIRWD